MWFLLLAGGICIFGIGTGIGYNIGGTAVSQEWLLKESRWRDAVEKVREEKELEMSLAKEKHDEIIMDLANAVQQNIKERDDAIHRLVNRGMYVTTEDCGDSMPTEAESASKSNSPAVPSRKIRIHGKSERDIRQMIQDAQELSDKYKALYKVCAPHIEIIPTKEESKPKEHSK